MKSEISSSPLSSHPHPFPIAICHCHWDFKVFLNYLSDIYWQLLILQSIFWCPSCPFSVFGSREKLHCILVAWSTGERLATLGTSGGWGVSPMDSRQFNLRSSSWLLSLMATSPWQPRWSRVVQVNDFSNDSHDIFLKCILYYRYLI